MKPVTREQLTPADIDRRAHVRIKLAASITARRIGGGDSFTIEEASIAGLSVKSPVPFEPESTHHLRLSDAAGQVVVVGAVCRYCVEVDGSYPPSYLVGFKLEPPAARREPLILGVIPTDEP